MSDTRTVGDLFPSRRELLKLGGWTGGRFRRCGLATAYRQRVKGHPRGTARNVLFYEISGAISHVESFDFKENAGTPKDLDMRKVRSDLHLSHLLFPRLENTWTNSPSCVRC